MAGCWVHFAKTGSPNGCGLPKWHDYADGAAMMVLGTHPHPTQMRPDHTLRRLDRIYRWAGLIAPHPYATLVVALLIFGIITWMLVALARSPDAATAA